MSYMPTDRFRETFPSIALAFEIATRPEGTRVSEQLTTFASGSERGDFFDPSLMRTYAQLRAEIA